MAEYGVSEFLARERDDLGDLAGDIPGGNGGSGSVVTFYFYINSLKWVCLYFRS